MASRQIKILYNVQNNEGQYHLSWMDWAWAIILWLEVLAYYFIRKRITKPLFAWLHVIAMLTVTIFLPSIFFSLAYIIEYIYSKRWLIDFDFALTKLYPALNWGVLIFGHLFFIATIAQSFKKKQAIENDHAPGILDGIVEEH